MFLAMKPQTIFIFDNYDGYAEIYCHTPELDEEGYYALFVSTKYGRDHVLWGRYYQGSMIYRGHVKWTGPTEADYLMQNVMESIISI